jgi:hypothetical protein
MVSAISFTEELSSSAPAGDALHHLPDMLALLSSNDLISDISGEFDDLKGLLVQVEDRIVGCLDPHHFAVLPDALELCRLKFAAIEGRPELLILGAVFLDRINENAVVFAADLFECVAHCAQEVFIGSDDSAIEVELDNCLRLSDRLDLPVITGRLQLLPRDIGSELDDLAGPSV